VTREIQFSAKTDSPLYTSCLETMNTSTLHNIQEIRENAKRLFVEKEDENLLMGGNETFNVTKMLTG